MEEKMTLEEFLQEKFKSPPSETELMRAAAVEAFGDDSLADAKTIEARIQLAAERQERALLYDFFDELGLWDRYKEWKKTR